MTGAVGGSDRVVDLSIPGWVLGFRGVERGDGGRQRVRLEGYEGRVVLMDRMVEEPVCLKQGIYGGGVEALGLMLRGSFIEVSLMGWMTRVVQEKGIDGICRRMKWELREYVELVVEYMRLVKLGVEEGDLDKVFLIEVFFGIRGVLDWVKEKVKGMKKGEGMSFGVGLEYALMCKKVLEYALMCKKVLEAKVLDGELESVVLEGVMWWLGCEGGGIRRGVECGAVLFFEDVAARRLYGDKLKVYEDRFSVRNEYGVRAEVRELLFGEKRR